MVSAKRAADAPISRPDNSKRPKSGKQRATEDNAEDLRCPITKDLVIDPVVLADGFSYSRGAAMKILAEARPKSPFTRQAFSSEEAKRIPVSNRDLRGRVFRYLEANPSECPKMLEGAELAKAAGSLSGERALLSATRLGLLEGDDGAAARRPTGQQVLEMLQYHYGGVRLYEHEKSHAYVVNSAPASPKLATYIGPEQEPETEDED